MKTHIIRPWLNAVLIIFFIISACSKSGDGYGGGSNNPPSNNNNNTSSVSMGSSSFSPASITVKTGTTVTWTNNNDMLHTVTADDGSFNSGDLAYTKTYSHTFSQAGTFHYHCAYHANMKGTVMVN
ncbi:cupredoxin domain-containing protein [Chitinophagaceae bacterium LB-8]|uniref:Cupredoxin domain-containing protein n=1 Tax=Paraflavisolibacter caeni TaxID=2982496 RepID=A0A9X2XY35_9BACT|nr:cupredoxin domain-containing protein [Paraflavisolibacter caeni]MCU7551531.1 cupredoxin domain-containing protein [Paraflavisolibacter caeni]